MLPRVVGYGEEGVSSVCGVHKHGIDTYGLDREAHKEGTPELQGSIHRAMCGKET